MVVAQGFKGWGLLRSGYNIEPSAQLTIKAPSCVLGRLDGHMLDHSFEVDRRQGG